MRKRYNKAKSKLRSSKKSGISTKESEEIVGEQSAIAFMRCLDPYIVNRISKNNFEGEDDQDVQSDMENEGDFLEQEGLQKNEEDELLQDNLNDEFGEENTSLSKGTKITPRGSKKRKEMSLKEEDQETDFLKVANQNLQKEESEGDLLANLMKRKVEKLPRQLIIMCETELHQILLKYEVQAFQNTTVSAQQPCQNVLPESHISSGFSSDSKAGNYTNLLLDEN